MIRDESRVIGPGQALKRTVRKFGIWPRKNCNCTRHAKEMDERGPDWCEQNIDRICGWIKHECRARGIPFVRPVVIELIQSAIAWSRKTGAT